MLETMLSTTPMNDIFSASSRFIIEYLTLGDSKLTNGFSVVALQKNGVQQRVWLLKNPIFFENSIFSENVELYIMISVAHLFNERSHISP